MRVEPAGADVGDLQDGKESRKNMLLKTLLICATLEGEKCAPKLLAGGKKSGMSHEKFYRSLIEIAYCPI